MPSGDVPIEDRIDYAITMGDHDGAAAMLRAARADRRSSAVLEQLRGELLLRTERPKEARTAFGLALKLAPDSVELRLAMSRACVALGESGYAAWWLMDVCRLAPGQPVHWLQLIQMLEDSAQMPELEQVLRMAVAANPNDAALVLKQADYHHARGAYRDAMPLYASLVRVDPANAEYLVQLGTCLELLASQGIHEEHWYRLEEAAAAYLRATGVDPDCTRAHIGLSGALWRLGDFDGALTHARRALDLEPDHLDAVRAMATALMPLNRPVEATAFFRRTWELVGAYATAPTGDWQHGNSVESLVNSVSVNFGQLLLLSGNIDEGWEFLSRRRPLPKKDPLDPFADTEAWLGPHRHPLQGKRLVVHGEWGLGDEIQFLRYLTLAQAQGAKVFYQGRPMLKTLAQSMADVTFLAPGESAQVDYRARMTDLLDHYRGDWDDVPCRAPYLHPPTARIDHWHKALAPWDGTLKVGLAWAGDFKNVNQFNRSIALSTLGPLLEMEGVQCFSLQVDAAGRFRDTAVEPGRLVDFTASFEDCADSAAMIANLDLVIGVCSAVIHLSAAIGQRTWGLLPPNGDWRWGYDREDSPWYPSMRLFRRGHREPQSSQVARVAQALAAMKDEVGSRATGLPR